MFLLMCLCSNIGLMFLVAGCDLLNDNGIDPFRASEVPRFRIWQRTARYCNTKQDVKNFRIVQLGIHNFSVHIFDGENPSKHGTVPKTRDPQVWVLTLLYAMQTLVPRRAKIISCPPCRLKSYRQMAVLENITHTRIPVAIQRRSASSARMIMFFQGLVGRSSH
jgi:hypothetical protein